MCVCVGVGTRVVGDRYNAYNDIMSEIKMPIDETMQQQAHAGTHAGCGVGLMTVSGAGYIIITYGHKYYQHKAHDHLQLTGKHCWTSKK